MTDTPWFLPPKGQPLRLVTLALLIAAPFIFGAIALWLGQDANWDLRNYHWYNAYAFLHGRYTIDLLPSQTPWFYNPTIDLPFYLLASHAPARVAGFMLGWVQGLNFVLLFMLGYAALTMPNPRRKFLTCATLAALGMYGGGGIALLGTTFYDNVTSLGIFLSALLIIGYWPRLVAGKIGRACRLALLCGMPAGIMIGLKLPSIIFGVALCGALLLTAERFKRGLVVTFAFGLGLLLGIGLSYGHWGWFLQTHFGSPMFPYFNQWFQSPLAPVTSARDTQYVTRSLHDALLFPFIFAGSPSRVGEIMWRDWRLPILYVLIPAAMILRLIFGPPREAPDSIATPAATRFLLWFGVLGYFTWLGMFCIYRYAVPLEMLAPLLIVLACGLLPLKTSWRDMLTLILLLVVAWSVQGGNWSRRAGWLDHFVEVELPPLPPAPDRMIILAGFEPYAHLLPAFPPDITFLRIESNFASPGEPKGINEIIKAKLLGHRGPLMLLIPSAQHGFAADALHFYGLTAEWRACQTVTDRLYLNQLYDLCPVK